MCNHLLGSTDKNVFVHENDEKKPDYKPFTFCPYCGVLIKDDIEEIPEDVRDSLRDVFMKNELEGGDPINMASESVDNIPISKIIADLVHETGSLDALLDEYEDHMRGYDNDAYEWLVENGSQYFDEK